MILHEVQENKRILNEFEVGLWKLKDAMYPYLNFSQVL